MKIFASKEKAPSTKRLYFGTSEWNLAFSWEDEGNEFSFDGLKIVGLEVEGSPEVINGLRSYLVKEYGLVEKK